MFGVLKNILQTVRPEHSLLFVELVCELGVRVNKII